MTRTEIYNIALRQHGKKCTQEEVLSQTPPYEVELCNTYYDAAVRKVLGESDWAFILRRVEASDCEDRPQGRWAHGFVLPPFTLRVSGISTKPYQIIGRTFLTNEADPDIYIIPNWFESEMAPDDICQLIGLALAYGLCGILAPANNAIAQLIIQNYSWILQPMITAEAPAYMRSVEEGGPADGSFGY